MSAATRTRRRQEQARAEDLHKPGKAPTVRDVVRIAELLALLELQLGP